jgi:hypothetical protein
MAQTVRLFFELYWDTGLNMNDKKLMKLGIIAVIAIAAAIVVNHVSKPRQSSNLVIGPLVGGLDVDQVAKITISGDNNKTNTSIVRSESRFVVAQKDNYPASAKRVNELIGRCLDIRTAELRTEDAAFHKDLGVSEDTAANVVTLLGADDKPIIGIFVSRPAENGSSYVRLASENKVYLTLNAPYISSTPMDYIDTNLLEADSKKITEVSITDPNGVSYTLKSADEGATITLDNMPAGKQFKGTEYRNIFTALSNLPIEDVTAASKVAQLKLDWKYVCKLSDSTIYTLGLGKQDNKTYLAIATEFTDTAPVVKEQGQESQEQLKVKEAKLLARDAAERFGKKTFGWVYVIPENKTSSLMRDLKNLVEDIPSPAPANSAAKTDLPIPAKPDTPAAQ